MQWVGSIISNARYGVDACIKKGHKVRVVAIDARSCYLTTTGKKHAGTVAHDANSLELRKKHLKSEGTAT